MKILVTQRGCLENLRAVRKQNRKKAWFTLDFSALRKQQKSAVLKGILKQFNIC